MVFIQTKTQLPTLNCRMNLQVGGQVLEFELNKDFNLGLMFGAG